MASFPQLGSFARSLLASRTPVVDRVAQALGGARVTHEHKHTNKPADSLAMKLGGSSVGLGGLAFLYLALSSMQPGPKLVYLD